MAQHVRWRKTPQSSREIARRHLNHLADLCETEWAECSQPWRHRWNGFDQLAETHLWVALKRSGGWPKDCNAFLWLRDDPDLSVLASAARSAATKIKGGDYVDYDLAFTVSELIRAFEHWTGNEARAGRFASETPICALAYAFFDIVEPHLDRKKIFNVIEAELRHRRRVRDGNASD